jgi:hypothetical protein
LSDAGKNANYDTGRDLGAGMLGEKMAWGWAHCLDMVGPRVNQVDIMCRFGQMRAYIAADSARSGDSDPLGVHSHLLAPCERELRKRWEALKTGWCDDAGDVGVRHDD